MDRFTVGIVAGVLLLVVAAIGAAFVVRGRDTPPDLTTPSGVTLAFSEALRQGDAEAAWNLLAPSAQASTKRETFLVRAGTMRSSSNDRTRLLVEDEKIEGDTATVELARVYRGDGGFFSLGESYSTRSTVRLQRVDGSWRITVPAEPFLLLDRG